MRIYWKILDNGKSYIADEEASVAYPLGKWVKAPRWLAKKGYYLTVFRTKKDAMAFMAASSEGSKQSLKKCYARGIIKDIQPR